MTHPDYDPEAEPVPLDELDDEGVRVWVDAQMQRLAQIRAEEKDGETERKAIYAELVPVLQKIGRPLRWRDPVTHEETYVKPVAAETKSVDLARLYELTEGNALARDAIRRYVKETLPFDDLERLVNEGAIDMEVAAEVMRLKPKAAYVKF